MQLAVTNALMDSCYCSVAGNLLFSCLRWLGPSQGGRLHQAPEALLQPPSSLPSGPRARPTASSGLKQTLWSPGGVTRRPERPESRAPCQLQISLPPPRKSRTVPTKLAQMPTMPVCLSKCLPASIAEETMSMAAIDCPSVSARQQRVHEVSFRFCCLAPILTADS